MSGGVPRALSVAVVLALVVAAGAFGGAAAIRWRAIGSGAPPSTSQNSPPTSPAGTRGCLVEPCTVLSSADVGGTRIELLADSGLRSGRLRIGGANASQVIETEITYLGVTLNTQSLQCVPGGPAACMIKGEYEGGIAGEVIVGRSDSWSRAEKQFTSDAGYLALANTDGDAAPEVVAAQHDCRNSDTECATRPIFLQVFALTGTAAGCSRNFTKLTSLPGYPPTIDMAKVPLTPCK
jgi:hypothetical protein